MGKKQDEKLLWLQQELLAAEEEEYEEIDEYEDEDFDLDELLEEDPEDWEEDPEDWEEEDDPEPCRPQVSSRYSRGSQKKFDDREFFDDDVEDEEFLYQKDFKKAKKKKARKNIGLVLLAILELLAIAGVLLWWSTWAM